LIPKESVLPDGRVNKKVNADLFERRASSPWFRRKASCRTGASTKKLTQIYLNEGRVALDSEGKRPAGRARQ